MIFLTVGTQFPFDRLVEAIDKIADDNIIEEDIFAQTGESLYKPRNFKTTVSLNKPIFDDYINKASKVISHAGMGTITAALEYQKPLLVVPRLKKYGEVVNDHQVAICRKFEQLGHLLVAYDTKALPKKLQELKTFMPRLRKSQAVSVAERISRFLHELSQSK